MPFEIKVTNAWVNRIVGDRQPNTTKTYTFTSPKYYKADSKLVPSGLLGPVQIVQSTAEPPLSKSGRGLDSECQKAPSTST